MDRRSKPVIEFVKNDGTETIKHVFENAYRASEFYTDSAIAARTMRARISQCCAGKRPHHKGLFFRYATAEEVEVYKKSVQLLQQIEAEKELKITPGFDDHLPEDGPAETIAAKTERPLNESGLSTFEERLRNFSTK